MLLESATALGWSGLPTILHMARTFQIAGSRDEPSISGSCWEFQAFHPAISAGNPRPMLQTARYCRAVSDVMKPDSRRVRRMVKTGLPGNFTQPMATGRKDGPLAARLQLLQPRLPSLRGRARPLELSASPREITAFPSREKSAGNITRSWLLPDENPSSIPSRSESIRRWS